MGKALDADLHHGLSFGLRMAARLACIRVWRSISLNSCLRYCLQNSDGLYSIAAAASSYGNKDPDSKGTQDGGAEFATQALPLAVTSRHLSSSIVTCRQASLATKCPRLPSTVVTCYQVSFLPSPRRGRGGSDPGGCWDDDEVRNLRSDVHW